MLLVHLERHNLRICLLLFIVHFLVVVEDVVWYFGPIITCTCTAILCRG